MGKKLLSKLDKYFTKGVKIGALATAVLMGATACDEPAVEVDPIQAYRESTIDYDKGLESYIFLRHRFAEVDDHIAYSDSNERRIAWSNKHYQDAKDYMLKKIADFKDKVYYQEPDGNFLAEVCEIALSSFNETWNKGDLIKLGEPFETPGLDNTTDRLTMTYPTILGAIQAKFDTIMDKQGDQTFLNNRFQAHCLPLFLRAYNDSLGNLANSTTLPLNQERDSIDQDLRKAVNGAYGAEDYDQIEQALDDMLAVVARETGVSLSTLRDAVNMVLLTSSLRGVSDLGKRAGVQLDGDPYRVLLPRADYNLTKKTLTGNMNMGYGSWINEYYQQWDEQHAQEEQDTALTR